MTAAVRVELAQQLENYGLSPQEAKRRVDSLTDTEIAFALERVEKDPVGKNVVGIIVGAAVLIFLVLLVTDLLGYTDIFPFVKKSAK